MTNKNYLKGYRFEIRVIKSLEKLGWFAIRSAKSRFPDSFAAKDGWSFYIECKNRKKMPYNKLFLLSKEERDKSSRIINTTSIPLFLFYNENRKIRILAVGGKGIVLAGTLERDINERKRKVQPETE